jgi:hypothetical protein
MASVIGLTFSKSGHVADFAVPSKQRDHLYSQGKIYSGFSQPSSYPNFPAAPCDWDYLTNTIRNAKIFKDWIHRRCNAALLSPFAHE